MLRVGLRLEFTFDRKAVSFGNAGPRRRSYVNDIVVGSLGSLAAAALLALLKIVT